MRFLNLKLRASQKKDFFFNLLTGEDISEEDYSRVKKFWQTFKIKDLGCYQSTYNRIDTCQLADVFENYRTLTMEQYKLDPLHFFSGPGLSWEAGLLMTGVELDLITDIDMQLMIESGIRGGTSMVSKSEKLKSSEALQNQEKATTHEVAII